MKFSKKKPRKTRYWQLTPLQKQLIAGAVILVAVSLIITAVYYASRIDSLQIREVSVVGGETIPHSLIEDTVRQELAGTYMHLIPKQFMPLYPKDRIHERVAALDRVKNVHVELGGNQTLIVAFDEYVPYALWCEHPDSRACLFIDATGYAFAASPALLGSAFVRYTQEGVAPAVDTSGFDRSFIEQSETFIQQLEQQLDLYVTHVIRRGAYDVDYTIAGGGVIKVSQSVPMQESFENLQTILLSDEFKHIAPGSFQYIDLRFGEKIFVNEEVAAPAEANATTIQEEGVPSESE